MDYVAPPPVSWFGFRVPCDPSRQSLTDGSMWSVGLRLQYEKDFLENSLADCVTYLQALRRKQAENERRLSANSSLPRKRKKQIQQSTRELIRNIRCREGDERALLTNLQACNANIYFVENLMSPSATQLSTIPDATSGSTHCSIPEESEPTEYSWNGWTDDTIVSPFQRQTSNPFFLSEVAPDECSESNDVGDPLRTSLKRPPLIIRTNQSLDIPLPLVPPNTAASQPAPPMLDPKATEFQPRFTCTGTADRDLSDSSITSVPAVKVSEPMQTRRATEGGINPSSRDQLRHTRLTVRDRLYHTWCNTTPQRSPDNDAKTRTRTSSL